MRNPAFWRKVALAWALSGVVAGAAAFLLPEQSTPQWLLVTLACYGLMGIIFGGAFAFWSHSALRAQRALQNDDEVLGRWHIDAATWRRYVARNGQLDRESGALVNELSIRDAIPDDGVAIVVGREAVQIDESVHEVPLRGTPEVTQAKLVQDAPDYIELLLLYPGGGSGASGVPRLPTRTALRFPVAPTFWRDARGIVAHFNRLMPQKADFFHGKGDGSDPEDLNTCIACGYRSHTYGSRCPKCGAGMLTRRWGRRFGGFLALCGLFITVVMGGVVYYTAPMLMHPGRQIDSWRFSGNAPQGLAVAGVFALVLSFGLTTLCYGIWQVKTGKRDLRVVYAMLIAWTILIMIANVISNQG